jgi:hypothetical protein
MRPSRIRFDDLLVPFRFGEVFSKLSLRCGGELSPRELGVVAQSAKLQPWAGCRRDVGLDKACYSF